MKARAIHFSSRFAMMLILAIIGSCDSLDSDGVHPTLAQTDYYTLPGSSIIVDLTSLAKKSFANVSLSITEDPTKGVLSQVNALLLKYKPGLEFIEGDDQFVLTVKSDGKIISTQQVKIHIKGSKAEFPCATIAVEDKVQTKPGSTISIAILENDWFCSGDKSSIKISIHSNPNFGEAVVSGNLIVYTPGSAFKGTDEMIYRLITSSGETVYGIISVLKRINGSWVKTSFIGTTGIQKLYATADKSILAVADGAVFKSSDQGASWKKVSIPEIRPIWTIVLHPSGDLYATSGSYPYPSDKIVKSTDNGDTWSILNTNLPSSPSYLGDLVVSPNGTLQITVNSPGSVWRSADGISWVNQFVFGDVGYWNTIFGINDSTTLLFMDSQPTYMSRTFDSGVSWTEAIPTNAVTVPTNMIYTSNKLLYSVSHFDGLVVSRDFGGVWKVVNPKGGEINCITEGANGEIYLAPRDKGVAELEGNTWNSIGTGLATKNVLSILTIDEDVYVAVEPSWVYKLK